PPAMRPPPRRGFGRGAEPADGRSGGASDGDPLSRLPGPGFALAGSAPTGSQLSRSGFNRARVSVPGTAWMPAVVHDALGVVARGDAAQLKYFSTRTRRGVGHHEVHERRVVDKNEAIR